ncbi:MAG: RnfABCDGE type electron transport complex subunit B [Rhodoferax sp.]
MTTAPPAPGLAARILDALPQTQCRRCGYADCAAYAQAVAQGAASINQCPPGGAEGIARLSQLTGLPVVPLDATFGTEGPRGVAIIDEAWCIGCTLCLEACPVDAIIGTHKRMHTVIESHCTGCELCLPACPVDCIHMETVTQAATGWSAWSPADADKARARYAAHARRREPNTATAQAADQANDPHERKRSAIEAALARAREKRAATGKAP